MHKVSFDNHEDRYEYSNASVTFVIKCLHTEYVCLIIINDLIRICFFFVTSVKKSLDMEYVSLIIMNGIIRICFLFAIFVIKSLITEKLCLSIINYLIYVPFLVDTHQELWLVWLRFSSSLCLYNHLVSVHAYIVYASTNTFLS